jgi:hypothetical protein
MESDEDRSANLAARSHLAAGAALRGMRPFFRGGFGISFTERA